MPTMVWFSKLLGHRETKREFLFSPEQSERLERWRTLPEIDQRTAHVATRYVVVDVESSGLNMKKDRLISIGAVALVDGKLDFKDSFQVILRQEQVSTHENILIHGIGGSAQSEGVDPVEALLAFLEYIGKAPLVAYHAFFDQAMIDKAMREYLGLELGRTWIDLAWVLPDFFQYRTDTNISLDDWLKLFGIENILRHNAVSDAFATAQLLQVAIAAAIHKGAESPDSFLQIEKARRWLRQSR
jgi:DNA polymerase-3 subunit epsilon